jgi:ABC-type glycerol-3-phosphate transport system permease component
MLLVCGVVLFPVLYAVLSSFKTNMELVSGGKILPQSFNFDNYIKVWNEVDFAQYTLNSLTIAVSGTVIAVLLATTVGYCLQRYDFPLKNAITVAYYSTMFISFGSVILRPLYLLAVKAGLQNTLIPIILILVGSQGVGIFLVTRFIQGIPKELDESAAIDGCGPFRIYWNIILPQLKPIIAVIALFQFRTSWNDYITSSIFTMTSPELRPLTVGVVQLKYGATSAMEWHLMMTGTAFAIIPMLLVYIVANKQFVAGAMQGSIKG